MSQLPSPDKKHSCSVCGAAPAYPECDGSPYTVCMTKRINELERETLAWGAAVFKACGNRHTTTPNEVDAAVAAHVKHHLDGAAIPSSIGSIPRYYIAVTSDPEMKFEYPVVEGTGFVKSPDGAWMRTHDVMKATPSATAFAPSPRMQAAWDEMRAFEKKYHVGVPSQSLMLCLDLVEFYPERRAYILACDEFYKASREQMRSHDIGERS